MAARYEIIIYWSEEDNAYRLRTSRVSDSEPRLVLMVGRARRVGTELVIGNIFLPTIPRVAIPGDGGRRGSGSVAELGLDPADFSWNCVENV
jgi:hypothetical protein